MTKDLGFHKDWELMDRIQDRLYPNDDCWEWTGATSAGGYGHVTIKRRVYIVSRVVWEIFKGPIPVGLIVCHICDNPRCCNILHLFIGTHKDNAQDAVRKGRKVFPPRPRFRTHCRNGHQYTPETTGQRLRPILGQVTRVCLLCKERAA